MERTSRLARLGLWRVTRHRTVRRLYERLDAAGVFCAQLDRFERDAAQLQAVDGGGPEGVSLRVTTAADHVPAHLEDAPVAPGDRVVVVSREGDVVGCCCLSDRPVYVPELHRRLTFDGAYLWRLYVEPEHRGRGVGTAIVARAVDASATVLDADRTVALVAPDNVPSRRAFRRLGFRPTERFTSVGVPGHECHRRSALDT